MIETVVGPVTLNALRDTLRTMPPGCVVEVGVWKGGSAWYLLEVCREQGRELFLYDTFTGMPFADPDDSHGVGDFNGTSAEEVQAIMPDAHVIAGIFPDTLVEMPPIAFAHVDCDQYRSVKSCIDVLSPLMVAGGMMWFDDYACTNGCTKAVHEAYGEGNFERIVDKAQVRF